MKLVQLVRPLFLMALGLHALVLFLPVGDELEAVVVEDVDFSDKSGPSQFPSKNLSEGASRNQGQLPVADPNALAAVSKKTAPKLAALPPAAVAVRPAPSRSATTPATARRPNPSASSSTGSVPNLTVSDAESSANNSQTDSTPPAASTAASISSRPSTSNIPDLTSRPASQTTTAADAETSPSIETLLAKLTRSVSKSLLAQIQDLSKSLAYSEADTDDSSTNQNRADWKADIQRQANIGTVESIAPTEISDLTEISYPIESPKQADMKARSLSLCLEKEPHSAEVGVLFDAQGNVADKPALIRSTGYDALNNEIIATVLDYKDFPPNRNSKAYLLEFEINYNAETCVSLEELKE